jgi:hypothetical protein
MQVTLYGFADPGLTVLLCKLVEVVIGVLSEVPMQ